MKKNTFKYLLPLFTPAAIAFLLIQPAAVHTQADSGFDGGGQEGHGGDGDAADFVSVGRYLSFHLSDEDTGPIAGFDRLQFISAIEKTEIRSSETPLSLNGHWVDAINYPAEKRIIFYRGSWDQFDEQRKETLVLHEYLSILGYDDTNYYYSANIIARLHSHLPTNGPTPSPMPSPGPSWSPSPFPSGSPSPYPTWSPVPSPSPSWAI